jgi:hypothetical protein
MQTSSRLTLIAIFATWSVASASVLSFNGNLRTDATVLDCGPGCTLTPANSDSDFAQWAAEGQTARIGVHVLESRRSQRRAGDCPRSFSDHQRNARRLLPSRLSRDRREYRRRTDIPHRRSGYGRGLPICRVDRDAAHFSVGPLCERSLKAHENHANYPTLTVPAFRLFRNFPRQPGVYPSWCLTVMGVSLRAAVLSVIANTSPALEVASLKPSRSLWAGTLLRAVPRHLLMEMDPKER